ncbi:MAG: AEC family transporter [Thainema sp.]
MTISVTQKAIALGLLIAVGYLLKGKFPDPSSVKTLRTLILNVALPATIFLSTLSINTDLNLALLPSFAIAINLVLIIVGFGLTRWFMRDNRPPQVRALALLFPSLAPGLTVYPFIEQFLGRDGLAWAALADVGNKLFVLVGLYTLAFVWYQRSQTEQSKTAQQSAPKSSKSSAQWLNVVRFLVTEPVNIAIVAGLGLAFFQVTPEALPPAVFSAINSLAACATPLILIYIGLSLNLKSLQLGKTLAILLARSGVGFLISAAAIALLQPTEPEALMLFVALPQASCSLWPLLHATTINQQAAQQSSTQISGNSSTVSDSFFDVEFATALLALSFPFSISVLMIVFSNGMRFTQPLNLGLAGLAGLVGCAIAWGYCCLPIRIRLPLQMRVSRQHRYGFKLQWCSLVESITPLSASQSRSGPTK